MDSARSWLHKFQPREKPTSKKNELGSDEQDENEENLSKATRQKAVAAKQYIENHNGEQMKNLQERKERRVSLEKKLAEADVSEEDQYNILKYLEQKETLYTCLQRHRMGADDFELFTIIGKGAFGEIYKKRILLVKETAADLHRMMSGHQYRNVHSRNS